MGDKDCQVLAILGHCHEPGMTTDCRKACNLCNEKGKVDKRKTRITFTTHNEKIGQSIGKMLDTAKSLDKQILCIVL